MAIKKYSFQPNPAYRSTVEAEAKQLTNGYQFQHLENQNRFYYDLEFAMYDLRYPNQARFKPSFAQRTGFKMRQLQALADYYMMIDQQPPVWLSKNEERELPKIAARPITSRPKNRWSNRYLILDFETASHLPTSGCQIGLIVVEDNQIIWSYQTYFQPRPKYFAPCNIRLHGINEATVHQAPTFSEVWSQIAPYFNGQYIVLAHNAVFDIDRVLGPTLASEGLKNADFIYACTLQMYRRLRDYPSFSLHNLAKRQEISFKHHDALEDSLVLLDIIDKDFGSLEDFFNAAVADFYKPLVFKGDERYVINEPKLSSEVKSKSTTKEAIKTESKKLTKKAQNERGK